MRKNLCGEGGAASCWELGAFGGVSQGQLGMGLALQGEMGDLWCTMVMEAREPMKPQAESPWGWEGAEGTDR